MQPPSSQGLAACVLLTRAHVWQSRRNQERLVEINEEIEVLHHRGKSCDFYRGKVVEHMGSDWVKIEYEDGEISVANLAADSDESWRRAPREPESESVRLKEVARAARELRKRDRNVGLVQERDARLHTLDQMIGERLAAAAKTEALMAERHPPLRVEMPVREGGWVVMCNGMAVFSPVAATPFEVDQIVCLWATTRCRELDCVDPDRWLVATFPFELAERDALRLATGLVALAGPLDQTGAGDENHMRRIYDDFSFQWAPPVVVPAVEGAHASHGGVVTEVRWASGERLLCTATPTGEGECEGTADVGRCGAMRSGNLIVFAHPMPQPGQCGSLGEACEVATGFHGWRTVVVFSPRRQAHSNALLGKQDRDGRSLVRLVPFTTQRELNALDRTRRLCARARTQLSQATEADAGRLAELPTLSSPPSTCELVSGVYNAVLGPDAFATSDGGTGGNSINLGYRERVQTSDTLVASSAIKADSIYPLRLRAVHSTHSDAAGALTVLVAPTLGQAADDLEATWPTVLAKLAAGLEDAGPRPASNKDPNQLTLTSSP